MKYEVPVCEMLEFCKEDIITTSITFEEGSNTGVGTGPAIDVDNGVGGIAS